MFKIILKLFFLPLIYINSNLSKNNNLINQQCSQQLFKLYSDFEETKTEKIKKKTLICLLDQNVGKMAANKLLNISSELLNCDQINSKLNENNYYYEKRIHNYGHYVHLGCLYSNDTDKIGPENFLDGKQPSTNLIILSAYFADNSKQFLYFTRKEWPNGMLKNLPKPKPEFKRFPTLDFRLPSDFFYPFFGC
ncbi:unnamed protein product [Meloidogyne enterolobii]|uniref:Uncharacterized protein n=1 Tax=Meloidogyne enterolobii TaxID=390850 RepID=A0ACB0YKL7_MELEN